MTSRFEKRRSEFLSQLGDTVAIIPAGNEQTRNDDVDHAFRQNSDFFFLTGFTEPDAVAVFDAASETPYTVFVRPKDPEMEAWNGRRAGTEGVIDTHGADRAFTVDELGPELRKHLVGRSVVGYTLGSRIDATVLGALNAVDAHSGRIGSPTPSQVVDVREILREMRLLKSPAEIDALRKACQISAAAHAEAMRFARPGITERQVQGAIEYVFASMGSERVGYGSIVAGGENAVILHYVENDQPLNDGELLLIDAGAEFEHLTADITRTFPIGGTFTAPQRAVYDLVLHAERDVIDICAPGTPYTDMHDKAVAVLSEGLVELGLLPGSADEVVAKGWYREFFFHGTGHWLGIDVHDAGSYRVDGVGRPMAPGMAFTVEPGLYIAPEKVSVSLSHDEYDADAVLEESFRLGASAAKAARKERAEEAGAMDFDVPAEFLGIGVRIEDDILITEDGFENMSSDVPVDPDEIEALCAEESSIPVF
ncbi:MAG: aminopeptidase P N-terminal domain-containing protein [Acidimicrobiia bacterium]